MSERTLPIVLEIFETDLGMDVRRREPETILLGDLGFDSVAVAIGTVAIEERLGVRLSVRQLLSCWTVADIVEAVDAASPGAAPDRRGP
ncbi:phosphopantetheine-binding protein [Nocardia sp. NPDC057030]|uniref:phosphopantetheine-binding protein n=1 Tax=unclassified Nocardia TaxID=2637762 RepID=UPI0036389D4F